MILKNASFAQFELEIRKHNKKLILFGAGTLLSSWIPYVLDRYALTERVLRVVDNAAAKWGKTVFINDKQFVIEPPGKLISEAEENIVILITSSYFAGMIEQLDNISGLDEVECYAAPLMHITKEAEGGGDFRIFKESRQRIPKVIHHCWFGKNPMPEKNLACMESWKKYCPDYEIVEWNESNYDVYKNRYMGQAYAAGKYGYVPDYARIDILYEHGGIYLDTDVEMIRPLDELLYLQAFTSFEEYPTVNFGGGSGSVKGLPILKSILEFREDIPFVNADGSFNTAACGYFETVPLQRKGLRPDGMLQNVQGLTVLPADYFHPKSSVTGNTNVTRNTYAVHKFDWSWVDAEQMKERKKTHAEYERILRRMQA